MKLLIQALTPIATVVVAWIEGTFESEKDETKRQVDELEKRVEKLEEKM